MRLELFSAPGGRVWAILRIPREPRGMARALRTDFAGALHHVTSRGNERRPIFYDDNDREVFLEFLGQTVRRFGWSVSAFVLMTNHFHLLVQTSEANLSRGMHWLNTKYVVWFNRIHGAEMAHPR